MEISIVYYDLLKLEPFKAQFIMNYIVLIDRLNFYDQDHDCMLSYNEFKAILKDLQVTENKDLVSILFNACSSQDAITFNNIRLIYEASFHGLKNHTMLVLMFCGIDNDKDRKLQFDEYYRLAQILDPSVTESGIKDQFDRLDSNQTGTVTYPQVARSLYGIRVRAKENPYKTNVYYRCPETGCCLLL